MAFILHFDVFQNQGHLTSMETLPGKLRNFQKSAKESSEVMCLKLVAIDGICHISFVLVTTKFSSLFIQIQSTDFFYYHVYVGTYQYIPRGVMSVTTFLFLFVSLNMTRSCKVIISINILVFYRILCILCKISFFALLMMQIEEPFSSLYSYGFHILVFQIFAIVQAQECFTAKENIM